MKVFAIIPARYSSSRFPAKMLHPIAGKTLLEHTFENAKRCSTLTDIAIATDDERIFSHAKTFCSQVFMTSPTHLSGTDRIAEVVKSHRLEANIVVNIQGDEPLLPHEAIEAVVAELKNSPSVGMATAVCPVEPSQAKDPSVVKCVFSQNRYALYFSRSLIPSSSSLYYQHCGIYAFRPDFLMQYAALPATPLQKSEDLEQLKALESGYSIKVAIIQENSPGVNTLEDLSKVESILCQRTISSSQAESAPL